MGAETNCISDDAFKKTMKAQSNSCYWCGSPVTTREHVPPKCLFPESKDSADSVNYRRNLITVPSCDLHNLAKSNDDEYLLAILSLNCDNNEVGQRQAMTKLVRALRRSEGFKSIVMRDPKGRFIFDREKGFVLNTAGITIDRLRLNKALEHIGRGLYFHYFGCTFPGQIRVYIEFLVDPGSDLLGEASHPQRHLRSASSQMFAGIDKRGSCPDVFFFQIAQDESSVYPVMRLTFYGGSCATLVFGG